MIQQCAYYNSDSLSSDMQVWNHHFFWESMQPDGGGSPEGGVLQQIEKDFGSFTNFREEFIRSASSLLGSGWVWLVCKFPFSSSLKYRHYCSSAAFLICCL